MMGRIKRNGPSPIELVRSIPRLFRDPINEFLGWQRRYGDVVVVPLRRPLTLHLSNPEDLRHILSTNHLAYQKTGALIVGKRLMGEGLLASREPLHQQQRRIAQPHFLRHNVEAFASMMREATLQHVAHWSQGMVIDIPREMALLTVSIIGKAYFSTDLPRETAAGLYRDFGMCQEFMMKSTQLPDTFPLPLHRRYRNAVGRIDDIIGQIIRERLTMKNRPADLLTTLLEAKDNAGHSLTTKQIRDEMVNILLAGHETTAVALSWTWYFLSLHPAVEGRFHEELKTVLGENDPDAAMCGALTYTRMVLNESMRLRPPVWILGRVAIQDDVLPSGTPVPRGTEVLILPYIAHRNPVFFPNPEEFLPERFAEDVQGLRPPFVYFPFGGGPRGCIGETFARLEAMIILALIGTKFFLRLVDKPPVAPEPLVTLRPREGIRMKVVERPVPVQTMSIPREQGILQDEQRPPTRDTSLLFASYNLLVWIAVTFTVAWKRLRILTGDYSRDELMERLALKTPQRLAEGRGFLINAVSVGEMAEAERLISSVSRLLPGAEFVVTTGNNDGRVRGGQIQKRTGSPVTVTLLPWDQKASIMRWLDSFRPAALVTLETDIWPNLFRACHELGIPVVVVNGRVYERDVWKYRTSLAFFKLVFSCVEWIGAQTSGDARKFIAIGSAPEKVEVVGNIKLDQQTDSHLPAELRLGFLSSLDGRLIVAGSTHFPEERSVLEAFQRLQSKHKGLRLVLAPRHVARCGTVAQEINARGLLFERWSSWDGASSKWDVLLVDQIGWLPSIYALRPLVIMGGAFANKGGHNIAEASAYGCAVVTGPNFSNFKEMVEEFYEKGGVVKTDEAGLMQVLDELLTDNVSRESIGERGRRVVLGHSGCADRYAEAIIARLRAGRPQDIAANKWN